MSDRLVRNFVIMRIFEEDDEEFISDEIEVKLIDEFGKILLSGDYYHNKIDDRIEGFLEGLEYVGYTCKVRTYKVKESDAGLFE